MHACIELKSFQHITATPSTPHKTQYAHQFLLGCCFPLLLFCCLLGQIRRVVVFCFLISIVFFLFFLFFIPFVSFFLFFLPFFLFLMIFLSRKLLQGIGSIHKIYLLDLTRQGKMETCTQLT